MPEKPNILILFAEQHRGDCLSSDGHPVLLTPNIDAIGGAGTRFTNAYSTCPICVPARRSFLSGQFPSTHGARDNVNTEWCPEQTVGTAFRDAGYQTGWVGRSMHQYPVRKRFGFEEVVLMDHRCDNDDYDEYLRRSGPEGAGGYYSSGVMHNDWTARAFHLPEHLHHTNWTIYEAQRFLDRRDPTRPFLLVASFVAAHPPLIPPAFYFERYLRTGVPAPAIGNWAAAPANDGIGFGVSSVQVDLVREVLLSARAGYYGLINHLDDQIRCLFNGILGGVPLEDTIVVYTADHGEMLGDHYLWRKSVPYQGSVRIPMLISAPESLGLRRGQVRDYPVCLEDLMPTLLGLADIPVPASVEGLSLVPLLRGESPPWRRYLKIEYAGEPAQSHHTLTDGVEKYVRFTETGREQFFRLADDPNELHDLAERADEIRRVRHWRRALDQELSVPDGPLDPTGPREEDQ